MILRQRLQVCGILSTPNFLPQTVQALIFFFESSALSAILPETPAIPRFAISYPVASFMMDPRLAAWLRVFFLSGDSDIFFQLTK
jgi:hypothetical protein